MASNIDHATIGHIAAMREYRQNPDKSWPCVARRKCAVCGEMMEPGELISRASAPSPFGKLRHMACKVEVSA